MSFSLLSKFKYMKCIELLSPKKIVIGEGALGCFFEDFLKSGHKRLFILSIPVIRSIVEPYFAMLEKAGVAVKINEQVQAEPSFNGVEGILHEARTFGPDAVVGLGGGSVLDAAKFVAAQIDNDQTTEDLIGTGNLKKRTKPLVCLPTTAGTGSEVSPNAIFLDPADNEKKGIISPHLVPDAAYIDPSLMLGLPPEITVYTGIDAFVHCLEAYINRFAHPLIDGYALQGMKLIFENLHAAWSKGDDLKARAKVALGSLYGGMCLGPVNTAAAHALAYPLGSKYKIAHGLSNAVMLPYVLSYNKPAAIDRFALLAKNLGLSGCATNEEYASAVLVAIRNWLEAMHVPLKLSALGISETALDEMAASAMKVGRLLKNNVREIEMKDAKEIYKQAF